MLAADRASTAADGCAVVFVDDSAEDDDADSATWGVGREADVPGARAAGWRPVFRIKKI